ncbi:MAG: Crp/Fnr family transcriptional regulator [Arcobacter sp.]|uniref:Transcriptional regulator, Crp/Fnr family n=1 Tax=Arcobacter defluvii TaxID=873191 RepID=A0AAE7BF55_9BACT|nr:MULTISPECIES: Crp/Fnr family transcriptional regulator [Arcobacter]QKF76562.1 transcriptional regulator, Crp/Fnr family [Arcobacter defluvii]RXI34710.1 Crp/Fnr family transcriptional regulator [Arcobacter defluvii]BAK72371.1 putative transcriptional regulator [Arcobacter sp. L]
MILIETIKKIDFFNTLNEEQLNIIASFSNVSKYESKSILFYESDIKNHLLFLVDGLIKIYKVDKFGNEIFLYHIYKNSMISELSSMKSNDIYCFSNAEFVENSTILSVNFEKLQEYFLSKNILTTELMEILLDKTHQLQCIVNRELVFDATAKVAFMLNQDLEMFNKLKRQEVSFMLHIQPETLSRVLKRLSRDEIISIDNGEVIIENQNELICIFKGVGV